MKIKETYLLKISIIMLSVLIIIFILFLLIKKYSLNNKLYFQKIHINTCVPYDKNINYCTSPFDIVPDDKSYSVIERETLKSILNLKTTDKLMKLTSIFVPSVMYGTYCDQIYTIYYDFLSADYNPRIFGFLNEHMIKRVRIRHYYFNPNSYFEIKYKSNKIRVIIDCQYNILETIDPLYEEVVIDMLSKIKIGKIPELFFNNYKRFSFYYKSNQAIRMTIDINIKIKYLDIIAEVPFNILEIKYDKNITKNTIISYLKELEKYTSDKIEVKDFSKVDYSIDNIINPYNIKRYLKKGNLSI